MTPPRACDPCECDTLRAERDLYAAMLAGVRDIATEALNQRTPDAPQSADEPT